LDFRFESNIDKVTKEVERKSKEILGEAVANKMRKIRCPVHGTTPARIAHAGGSSEFHNFEIEVCCDRLREAIKAALKME